MSSINTNKYLKELFEFLSIESISAQTKHAKDMHEACAWLEMKFQSLGLKSEILPTEGHSVVYAETYPNKKESPTVLIYGHYDVQSTDPLNEWLSNPFKPEIRSGNIYARGVADDKGQLYTWIAALEELLSSNILPKVNLKFLIEGEEEIGSKSLEAFVKTNNSLFKADVCVISDSHCLSENQPLIEYGLRGIVYTQVKIKTLAKDAHSGLYGGNVLNPVNVLAEVIAKLKDKNHKVLIPDFYQNVRTLTESEKKEIKKVPFSEKEVLMETGATVVAGESDFIVAERAGARPTLDINGIWGGYQGEGPKTIIPSEAHAKISMRTVPQQTSSEVFAMFEKYIKGIIPKGVEFEVKLLSNAEPILFNKNSSFFKAAEKALKKVFGKAPIYELSGGTIGATSSFKNVLGIDSILMGYGLPDDGLHSPNEKLSLSMFEKGIKTNIEFLKNI